MSRVRLRRRQVATSSTTASTRWTARARSPPPPKPGPFPPGYPDPPPETTPAPTTDGTLIQGITYLSRNPDDFSNCVGQRGDYDGSGEAAAGVSSLPDQYLPGALT